MLSHFGPVLLFVTPWTVACQAPLFLGFSRQEYWRGFCMCESHTKWAGCGGRMTDEKHLICSGWVWTTPGLWACQFPCRRETWADQLPRVSEPLADSVGTITIVLDVVRLFCLPKLSPLHEQKAFVYEEFFFLMTSCLLNFQPATQEQIFVSVCQNCIERQLPLGCAFLRYLLLSLFCLPGSELHITVRGMVKMKGSGV